jgi:hypothetical protein
MTIEITKDHAHLNISSGDTLSNYVGINNVKTALGIWLPAITSCQVYLQGAYDTTSANFYRLQNAAATSTFVLNAGAGSKVFPVPITQMSVPYIRLEVSAAQADTRSCLAIVKL